MSARPLLALASWILCACLAACATTKEPPHADALKHRDRIDTAVDSAMTRFYAQVPGARELTAKAQAVLVFPTVVSVGFLVGAENGEGALRIADRTVGYYGTTTASFGFLAGAESKSIYLLFMNQEALDRFRSSKGWTIGADLSVTFFDVGADASVDTRRATKPVVGYVISNAGLMGKFSVDGAKVTKLAL